MVCEFCEILIFMGIALKMGQILWDFISQCEIWHVWESKSMNVKRRALGHVRPTKIQIRLRICAVWSESSLGAVW